MSDAPLLVLDRVHKRYPGVHAVDDVTMSVAPASVHALLGENGAGKSTLIKMVAGATPLDAGTMRFAGEPYLPRTPLAALRAGISTLYQEQNLLGHRSVAANVLLGVEPRRGPMLDRPAMRREVRGLLDRLGAGHVGPDVLARDLNVADRQRVDIAKALHRRARLLIMDEPTAALNAQETDALFAVLEALRDDGITILLVSHRLDDIFRLADTVTVLRDGRHISSGPIDAYTPDSLVAAMIGREPDTAFPPRTSGRAAGVLMAARGLSGRTYAGVDLEVRGGEILALAGLTGSGKEELGMTLGGALPARSGVLEIDGRARRLTPRSATRLGVVCVPADRKGEAVIEELSVQRNIALASLGRVAGRLGLIRRSAERALAERQRDALSLKAASLRVPVRELSGGNQQKVALGKWLAIDPRIMVLIEPTQGIDVGVRFELYRVLRRLTDAGKAIVLVSSDTPEVLGTADRIVVLRDGRIVGETEGGDASEDLVVRLSLGQPVPT